MSLAPVAVTGSTGRAFNASRTMWSSIDVVIALALASGPLAPRGGRVPSSPFLDTSRAPSARYR